VRAALGASPRQLLAGVATRAAALAGLGFAGGAALLVPASPLLAGALGGALDASVLVVTFAAVALAALAAALAPAWRAAHTDPARTLRAA
jgi:ABC-type antimicrobial peptide transport system permease subunit